jgi:hypothetical protein
MAALQAISAAGTELIHVAVKSGAGHCGGDFELCQAAQHPAAARAAVADIEVAIAVVAGCMHQSGCLGLLQDFECASACSTGAMVGSLSKAFSMGAKTRHASPAYRSPCRPGLAAPGRCNRAQPRTWLPPAGQKPARERKPPGEKAQLRLPV